MERPEILEMMATLQLSGMRAAYDEIVATGIKRQHSVERIIGALLKAEIAEKHARSIRYQMGIAKLPLAKEIEEFVFKGTPINGELVRDLAGGGFLDAAAQRGADRRHRHWQEPPRDRHRPQLHPRRRQGALLQRRRPGQQARGRGASSAARAASPTG